MRQIMERSLRNPFDLQQAGVLDKVESETRKHAHSSNVVVAQEPLTLRRGFSRREQQD